RRERYVDDDMAVARVAARDFGEHHVEAAIGHDMDRIQGESRRGNQQESKEESNGQSHVAGVRTFGYCQVSAVPIPEYTLRGPLVPPLCRAHAAMRAIYRHQAAACRSWAGRTVPRYGARPRPAWPPPPRPYARKWPARPCAARANR